MIEAVNWIAPPHDSALRLNWTNEENRSGVHGRPAIDPRRRVSERSVRSRIIHRQARFARPGRQQYCEPAPSCRTRNNNTSREPRKGWPSGGENILFKLCEIYEINQERKKRKNFAVQEYWDMKVRTEFLIYFLHQYWLLMVVPRVVMIDRWSRLYRRGHYVNFCFYSSVFKTLLSLISINEWYLTIRKHILFVLYNVCI